jgi:hypothetical protein
MLVRQAFSPWSHTFRLTSYLFLLLDPSCFLKTSTESHNNNRKPRMLTNRMPGILANTFELIWASQKPQCVIIAMIQMRNLRYRKDNRLVQCHTSSKRQVFHTQPLPIVL